MEFPRLVERVHAGGRVQHQQHFMRRAGQLLADDAMQLLQFLHQIVFCVQPARCVDGANNPPCAPRALLMASCATELRPRP